MEELANSCPTKKTKGKKKGGKKKMTKKKGKKSRRSRRRHQIDKIFNIINIFCVIKMILQKMYINHILRFKIKPKTGMKFQLNLI